MNWITDYVPPKIKSFFQRRDTPENLWTKCDSCGQMIFHRELAENQNVCPGCNFHMPISPRVRFKTLFDGGVFTEIEIPEAKADPLSFRDEKRYSDRMKDARRKIGEQEAMLVVQGDIFGMTTICAGQDFSFMAGSMGIAVGNAMLAAAEAAVKQKAPLVVFTAAGGARMQEGILSLMLGDVHLAEPGALIGFAGPRVIEQTIRETLPDGFQRSEYLLDHGMIDRVVERGQIREELGRILRLLMGKPPMVIGDLPAPAEPAAQPTAEPTAEPEKPAAEKPAKDKKSGVKDSA